MILILFAGGFLLVTIIICCIKKISTMVKIHMWSITAGLTLGCLIIGTPYYTQAKEIHQELQKYSEEIDYIENLDLSSMDEEAKYLFYSTYQECLNKYNAVYNKNAELYYSKLTSWLVSSLNFIENYQSRENKFIDEFSENLTGFEKYLIDQANLR